MQSSFLTAKLWKLGLALLAGSSLTANIDPSYNYVWGSNSGWIDGLSGDGRGVQIGLFYLSGYAWSPNTGWIYFGNGSPENGYAYRNVDNTDFGVSVVGIGEDGTLLMRGFAWSPNTGWMLFEEIGNPRIDPIQGAILGYIWSPNMGWITLGDALNHGWEVGYLPTGEDTDGDGIPDPFEYMYAGTINLLNETGDADGDGVLDPDEYLADTDPLDPGSRLRIVGYHVSSNGQDVRLQFTSSPSRIYRIRGSNDLSSNPMTWPEDGPGIVNPDIGTDITAIEFSQRTPANAHFHVVEPLLSLPE